MSALESVGRLLSARGERYACSVAIPDAAENEALSRRARKQRSDEAVKQLARPLLVVRTALTQRTPSAIRDELSCSDVIAESPTR